LERNQAQEPCHALNHQLEILTNLIRWATKKARNEGRVRNWNLPKWLIVQRVFKILSGEHSPGIEYGQSPHHMLKAVEFDNNFLKVGFAALQGRLFYCRDVMKG
jgi:hypothetical protein